MCAFDSHTNQEVAVKIIKSKKPFYQQALTEIELLQYLNDKDRSDQFKIVRLFDTFEVHRHQVRDRLKVFDATYTHTYTTNTHHNIYAY